MTCIANLSSDEVFTPPNLANQMLDLLPSEIWSDKHVTFLDPGCKSGVFLREIAKRLDNGLEEQIPIRQERMNHIFKNQLLGLAITELTALLSRRSVYCSRIANGKYSICDSFNNPDGNIRFGQSGHTWDKGHCKYCGANIDNYNRDSELESYAYSFIHTENPEELFKMKFDVIIGNPPYQLSDGGAGASAIPLYHKFVQQAKKMNPHYLSMIIPSRWFAGGRGLDEFRQNMQKDKRMKVLVDFPRSRECFPGVDIAGGVCYFLWDKDYHGKCEFISIESGIESRRSLNLDEHDIIIRDNVGIDIVNKVLELKERMMSEVVLTVNPFGIRSFVRGRATYFEDCITLVSSAGTSYIESNVVSKNRELINSYKVCIGYLNPDRAGVNNASDGMMNVTTKVRVLKANEIVTETYIIPFCDINISKVNNCANYIRTRFARFLISLTLTSMHIAPKNFSFLPLQDFKEIWTDSILYQKYGLTIDQIAYIESKIRPMEQVNE